MDKESLDTYEQKALIRAYDIAAELEESIFKTVVAAIRAESDEHSLHTERVARAESRQAWGALAEKLFEFANGDN